MSNTGPVIDIAVDNVRKVYDTNVFSVIRLAKVVIPHTASRNQGTVGNVGSIDSEIPFPWGGIYSSTEAFVHMECKPFNIDVVLISPGGVKSNNTAN
ncbi:hypothetical protein C8Q78DRAFT_1076689 [Trametes maxima]|nr:hypothetical protein C8Q78DRAFT_1076689 [Trametes maxima]